ncbi:MAG: hypothetical protein UH542_09580 [Bacteroidales bacterium]|nr:hypothetical protein [Bacteroidales bacterium]
MKKFSVTDKEIVDYFTKCLGYTNCKEKCPYGHRFADDHLCAIVLKADMIDLARQQNVKIDNLEKELQTLRKEDLCDD